MSRFLAAGIAVCLALSACTGTPGAEPSPSASATSAGTPTPSASDPAQDPLYLEAVEVYKAYLVELFKLDRAGGSETLPLEFEKYLAGSYRDSIEALYRKYKLSGEHMAPQPTPTLKVQPLVGVGVEGSEIAIEVCVDATKVEQLGANGEVLHTGTLAHRQLFFARQSDGSLKMMGGYGEAVDECPF